MNKFVDYLMMGLLATVLIIVAYWWIVLLIVFLGCVLQGGEHMEQLTKAQTYVSDFLYNIYLESDSKELDEWLIYLARENGDEQLAQLMGGNK